MKILFDTNVLISSFLTSGDCYEVIKDAHLKHEIFYTHFLIQEFTSVLRNKFHYTDILINNFSSFIQRFFIKGKTSVKMENICRDSKDNQILADALINEINVIITGDNDLLYLKNYRGIEIISPKDYWNL